MQHQVTRRTRMSRNGAWQSRSNIPLSLKQEVCSTCFSRDIDAASVSVALLDPPAAAAAAAAAAAKMDAAEVVVVDPAAAAAAAAVSAAAAVVATAASCSN